MAGFSPHSGEGAISTGPMVVVHDAKNVSEARAIVDLLEANQIPALVNLEIEGILFPWQEPPKNGAARVLVPSKMLSFARDVLRKNGSPSPSRGIIQAFPVFARDTGIPAPSVRLGPVITEEIDDEETGPIDLELPEPSPLGPRILFATLAVALGFALQQLLELAFGGHDQVLAAFAAKAPVTSEPWRLVSGGFLHMSPEHLLSNAAFGVLIGVVLFGTHELGATALVFLLSSIVGLGMEASLSTTALVAGASAGNYGLVGLWAKGQLDRAKVSLLTRREQIRTIGILLLLVPGAFTPVTPSGKLVAVIAHGGGFLAGFLLGFVFKRRLVPAEFILITRRSRIALAVTAAILVIAGASAMLFGGYGLAG